MNKIYSGFHQLPHGNASTMVQEGCIVLEGGAFRGLYGEGVLDALMLENINLRCTIGVSAGAMNGLNYVSGQIGRSIRMNLKYRHDKRYVGRKALQNGEGLIGFAFAFHQTDQEYPFDKKRFFQFDRRFIAVATNCETAEPAYFEKDHCRDIFQAVQASASMPFISKMVWMEGYPYLDGGCSDKIPFDWALREGYKKIIVVRTRPLSYRKKMDSITRKLPLEKTTTSHTRNLSKRWRKWMPIIIGNARRWKFCRSKNVSMSSHLHSRLPWEDWSRIWRSWAVCTGWGIMTPDGRFRTSAAICSRMEVFESCMKKTCIQ